MASLGPSIDEFLKTLTFKPDPPNRRFAWRYRITICWRCTAGWSWIECFEEKTFELLKLGKLVGFHHPNIGQEAVDVGTCYGLRKDDTIMPTHRGKGKYLMKGVDIKTMMAGMFGRKKGCGKGRGRRPPTPGTIPSACSPAPA